MSKLIPVTIPKWGIEMERGTIAEWRVSAGDEVTKGDELVDIETDKIVNSFEASHNGVLVRIIAEEGDELAVGTLIAVMAVGEVSEAEIDAFVAANAGVNALDVAVPTAAASAQSAEAGTGAEGKKTRLTSKLIPITIPKWGIEMERGTIAEWRVSAGVAVAKGDELVDIETDKIVNSFEAPHDGVLVRIIADEGDELAVGKLIGVMATEEFSEAEIDAFIAANAGSSQLAAAAPIDPGSVQSGVSETESNGTALKVSPALRRKAERLGIDLSRVSTSGYGGRILRDDIEAARSADQGSPLRQLQGAQKTIAERMTLAKQTIPHFYLQRNCSMDGVLAAQAALREQSGAVITVNHLLVHAVAGALREYPELNINVLPAGIRQLETIDVAIAVDTGDSLLTPLVRDIGDADIGRVAELAGEVVARTRDKKLTAADLQGGAVTVSNLGMLGVDSFTAIINPPQVMILAVGAVQEKLVLNNGKPETARYCSLSLACDHRVINGAAGAKFLAAICANLESL
jgi:pyruvate dehydrogenase E2 component (dihydrolipoamide acetyltransferase)